VACIDPYGIPPPACIALALAEGANPKETLYHAALAFWRYRLADRRLDRPAIEARIAELQPAVACAGADPAHLDVGGDHPVHRNERAGLKLALDIDAGLAPRLEGAVLAATREAGLEMRQAREETGIDTTHIGVRPDGRRFIRTRSVWAGLDSPRIFLGARRYVRIDRTPRRCPERRSARKAARRASGTRRRRAGNAASSSGSSDKPGEPPGPPPPAQPQRRGDEQGSGTTSRPRSTRGELVHVGVLVERALDDLVRLADRRAA
jgi:hypothetical protein